MVSKRLRNRVGGVGEAARLSRFWVASAALHLGTGAAVFATLPEREPEVEAEPADEVTFLPPPTDAPQLETPQDDRRRKAAERQRAEQETAPPKPKEPKPSHGLAGRAGAREQTAQASQGAAPVQSAVARRRKPARLPPVTKLPPVKRKKPVPDKAPEIDYGKARKAAKHTLDQFVGRITPDEALPEEHVFASLAERTAEAPALGDMPRVGRRGKLRRRAPTPRPQGDEGMGATGAPDIVRVDSTLRMDADLMRRHPYWKGVYDRVQPLWRFPRWAEEAKLQGEVHVAFRFNPETGGVSEFEIVRRSRIDGFDDNVIEAVQEAAPFGRVPVDAPSATKIVWPFKFRNPLF